MNRKNILIVEDEYIIALDIESKLMNYNNFYTEIVSTGENAVSRANKFAFDLILMDIKLEGKMDGIETVKRLQENLKIPVIYISGNSDLLNSQRLKDTHPIGTLTKPIFDHQLYDIMDELFQN